MVQKVLSREEIAFERASYNYVCDKSLKNILQESPYYHELDLKWQLIYNDIPVENIGRITIDINQTEKLALPNYNFGFRYGYFDLGFVVTFRDFVKKFKSEYENKLIISFNNCLLSFFSEQEMKIFLDLSAEFHFSNCKKYLIENR